MVLFRCPTVGMIMKIARRYKMGEISDVEDLGLFNLFEIIHMIS